MKRLLLPTLLVAFQPLHSSSFSPASRHLHGRRSPQLLGLRRGLIPSSSPFIRAAAAEVSEDATAAATATATADDAAAATTAPALASGAPPEMPSYRSLALFAGPALALWITGPLMSLIDNSAVGLSGSVQGLAALGPATTFVDGSQYLFAFISVATTNCLATAAAKDDDGEAALVVATAVRCALRCGLGVMALLLVAAPQMMGLYVGGATGAAVAVPAARYVRIRALSMPTTLLSNALQAALLGAKDSMTPLVALGAAALLNVVGDVFLVCGLGLGLSGAAAATVVSQWAGLALLARAATRTLPMPKEWGGKEKPEGPEREARLRMRKSFYEFCPPILGVVIGKMSAFAFMTHVASCLSSAQLAAHQLVLSVFFLLAPFSEISSQTFQAFLPQFVVGQADGGGGGGGGDDLDDARSAASPQQRQQRESLARRLTRRLQLSSLGVGVAVAALGALVPLRGARLFTTDAAVVAALKPLAVPLFISAALHSLVCSAEGALLVRRDLGFLSKLYAASAVLMPAALVALKRRGASLEAIWAYFCIFQATRAALLNWRVWAGHSREPAPAAA